MIAPAARRRATTGDEGHALVGLPPHFLFPMVNRRLVADLLFGIRYASLAVCADIAEIEHIAGPDAGIELKGTNGDQR